MHESFSVAHYCIHWFCGEERERKIYNDRRGRERKKEISIMEMIMTKGMFSCSCICCHPSMFSLTCLFLLLKQCSGLVVKSINWSISYLIQKVESAKSLLSFISNWIWGGDDIAICNWWELKLPTDLSALLLYTQYSTAHQKAH